MAELEKAKAEAKDAKAELEKAKATPAAPPPPPAVAAPPPSAPAPPPSGQPGVITLATPLQPQLQLAPPVVKLPPPEGHDPWFRCAYYTGMTNAWYRGTESERKKIDDVEQHEKMYAFCLFCVIPGK